MKTIDTYLNLKFFLILNALIIVLAETLGNSMLLFQTGVIHMIAISFVFLALLRVFFHYYTYDHILEKFIHASLGAMAIFAISHIIEFVSFVILHRYADAVYVNVANMYLISLLLIAIGAESFLRILQGRPAHLVRILISIIIGLVLLSLALLWNDELISLEMDSSAPIIYTVATFAAIGLCLTKMRQIKKRVDFMPGFVNYLSISIILIGVATLSNVYYEYFIDLLGLPEYQAVYFSHFAFYASLSFLFLAFGKVSHLGGMLDEVKNTDETRKVQVS